MNGVSPDKFEPLTPTEKEEVVVYWGSDIAKSFREFEVYKKARGFDVRFMPMSYYLPLITRRLNNYWYSELLEDKSLFGYLAKGPIRFPKCYVRTVSGEYYDENFKFITESAAKEICSGLDEFIVKAATGGHGGAGIEKIVLSGSDKDTRLAKVNEVFTARKGNLIVQEVLKEHESLRRFNPSSINTLRVQSLYLNGKVSVLSILLRMGTPGSLVDNACSGGCVVGVNHDGTLHESGYTSTYDKIDHSGNVNFKDVKLDQIPDLIKLIERAHLEQFPIVKYIGWDIMFDEQNTPVCIEVNTRQNGHLSFQLCCGPTFADRTEEVINYCKSKEFKY